MTTQPTPEQLAKLTNAAKLAYFNDGTIGITSEPIEAYVLGFLRAQQENGQAMRLMEKAANISAQHARKQALEDAIAIIEAARYEGEVDLKRLKWRIVELKESAQ